MSSRTLWLAFNESWGYDNPVLRREWIAFLRHSLSDRVRKIVIGALGSLIVLAYAYMGRELWRSTPFGSGKDLLDLSLYLQLLVACLLSPALVSNVICQERERETWGLLVITRLSLREICWGKFVGRLIPLALLLLLSCAPLTLMGLLRGGVNFAAFVMGHAVVIATAVFTGSIALLCSAIVRKSYVATSIAYAAVAVWLILVPILAALGWGYGASVFHDAGSGPTVELVHPFMAMDRISELGKPVQPSYYGDKGNAQDYNAFIRRQRARQRASSLADPLVLLAAAAVLFSLCAPFLRWERKGVRGLT